VITALDRHRGGRSPADPCHTTVRTGPYTAVRDGYANSPHWRVEAEALRRLIPGGLELDLFDGQAYVGAVPFTMEGVSPRLVPPDVPGLHRFPELNLRTYVKAGGKPSVWFFSLDAGQRLAVRVARRFFHLTYFDAKFQIGHKV
jgi:uncharacterized protein